MQLKREKEPYSMPPAGKNLTKHIIFEYANLLRKLKVASNVILFYNLQQCICLIERLSRMSSNTVRFVLKLVVFSVK